MFVSEKQHEGASIYGVRTEGGRGVPSKADIVNNLSKRGCVNLRTRGDLKIRKFCGGHNGSPQMENHIKNDILLSRIRISYHES